MPLNQPINGGGDFMLKTDNETSLHGKSQELNR